jgi:hypothetical protein
MSTRYFADTSQKYEQSRDLKQQAIHMASHFFGVSNGGYRGLTKTVHAYGTVEVATDYVGHGTYSSKERVQYGWITHARKQYLVVERGSTWEVLEERAIRGFAWNRRSS